MKLGFHIPIRYKILITLLFVVTAVVSAITFTMAHLFHADKRVYVSDLTSVVAQHVAQEADVLLSSYRGRLETCARLLADKSLPLARRNELLKDVLADFREMVAVSFYEGETEVGTIVGEEALRQGGLTRAMLDEGRRRQPLPFTRIRAGETYIANATLSDSLPTFTLAIATRDETAATPPVVAAVLRLDGLLDLSRQSRAYEVFLVDGDGVIIAHHDVKRVSAHERVANLPELATHSKAMTREYTRDGVEKIGGFARVGKTRLAAGAEVPKAVAYFASRELLGRLLMVALFLLCTAAIVAMFWSRRLTNSIAGLAQATRDIGQGRFDVNVSVTSRDEIGQLADAFNQMASELKTREKALKEAQAQLIQSEKLAAFGQLGAGIAHEIKNPLAGILGVIQLLQRQTAKDPTLRDSLQMVEKESRRCKRIVDKLLRFARQERAAAPLEPTDLAAVVADSVELMHHRLDLHQVRLEAEVEKDLPHIMGNANQIQQVLMNLILNADQAIEHGSSGHVRVRAFSAAGGMIELQITDDGPGIPRDIQARIFEPFFTTKPAGKGTGLGLSVTYGIVQEHGGTISVQSEVGKGATFIIRLPAAPAAAAGAAAAEKGSAPDSGAARAA